MSSCARQLLVFLVAAALNPGRTLAANVLEPGADWLKWSDDTRLVYISAYLSGHARGFRDGCEVGQEIYSAGKPSGLPGEKCIPKFPKHSENLEDYAATITNYYRSYPGDGHVPIFKLLEGLSDSRKLTIQQLHPYYGPSAKKPQ
jgi:hypothetical protein